MNKDSKIFIAGHKGMVGSSILRKLQNEGYTNLVFKTREELNLLDQSKVKNFFASEKPEYVFIAAAKVGGIKANMTYQADFLYENLQIQNNLIWSAHENKVKKLLFLSSTCVYPKDTPQPMKEEYIMTGLPEPTNEAYAVAKISGMKLCEKLRQQYGDDFTSCIPTNLYGVNDNFDLENSHVMPALIRKFHEAKINKQPTVSAWGTGSPRREFMSTEDVADGCLFLMNSETVYDYVNLGWGEDITIKELTELVAEVVGFDGEIVWDSTKPDGIARKLTDATRMTQLGWKPKVELREGLTATYEWYLANVTH
ncbi:GDP-fucose synthetase [candidate division WWE3 bacterium RIFOXYC1_FULL_39_7]|uniref:GDP-L-fucose synthase n=2 Tax=Katanobacteria TaxID=422282 RepID=A0A1F4X6K6_UNCKA|nr:MAG: GDP-fucose synthetase [candidate division WWE3 bacterium RIFOXYC1_FULL_39_7]OGC77335.1 MAG: GDP-fucose synthetase [candidate division WWE3 bacterium RIFOXYD1_FULL_39_9]